MLKNQPHYTKKAGFCILYFVPLFACPISPVSCSLTINIVLSGNISAYHINVKAQFVVTGRNPWRNNQLSFEG